MRVAFVLSALQAGGAERVIALISDEAIQRGWKVTIVTFDRPGDPIFHAYHESVRYRRLGLPGDGRRLGAPLLLARRVLALRRLLAKERFDVVVSFLTKINAITLMAGIGVGTPTIVSERNNPRRQRQSPVWKLLLDRLYPRAAAIVMLTRRSTICLPRSERARAVVIPNPMVVPAGATVACACHPTDRLQFVAVGRLNEQKGFDLLIDAFARIADACPAWDLVIWGEGPARQALEEQAIASGLAGRIALHGISSTHGSWINHTNVFILSSRYEGFANVLAEAMAAGLPVVSFDCDFGPADMIAHEVDGLLAPAEDVMSLADGMLRLAHDPLLRNRLGGRAAIRAKTTDLTHVTSLWIDLIQRQIKNMI